MSAKLVERNTTPSSVSAPDSSSLEVGITRGGHARACSENAWRECEENGGPSGGLFGRRRWGEDAARFATVAFVVARGCTSGGVSEYGGGLLLGALMEMEGAGGSAYVWVGRLRARVMRFAVPPAATVGDRRRV